MKVLRSMRSAADGLPRVGNVGTTLGPRVGIKGVPDDVEIQANGTVHPYSGGMSVSPHPITNFKPLRIPKRLGGVAVGVEMFELETDALPDELRYRPDPKKPERHGFIEPTRIMPFEEYQRAVQDTRHLWTAL